MAPGAVMIGACLCLASRGCNGKEGIETKALVSAPGSLTSIAGKKHTVPIAGNILIRAHGCVIPGDR